MNTLSQKAFQLQQRINRCIDAYGECTHEDADELERLCDEMSAQDQDQFIMLCQMDNYIQALKGNDRVLYKTSFDFHLKHVPQATLESAHQAGVNKLASVKTTKALVKDFTY